MSQFIESLEGRRLLTATAASLSAELGAVNTNSTTVGADLNALQTAIKTDSKPITTDLKGGPKTNAPLLAKLQKDLGAWITKVRGDVAALLKATKTSATGATDGAASAANPTNGGLTSKVTADINALAKAGTPLGKLTIDSSTAVPDADIAALTGANSSNAALATDAGKLQNDLNTDVAKLLSDAGTYNTAVGALKTDLTTLLPQPTMTPSLIGDYKGSVKTKAIIFGLGSQTFDMEIIVTDQTINSVTGSITIDNNTASGTITTTELSNGKLTLQLTQSGITITLTGHINVTTTGTGLPPGSVITGSGSASISGFKVDGDFTLTKVM